ncbi:Uncharacterised protein [Vibrio cholerae]|nr:Uncharacterised protein [Vibrio cholerae]
MAFTCSVSGRSFTVQVINGEIQRRAWSPARLKISCLDSPTIPLK